jgi:hypothetical protein
MEYGVTYDDHAHPLNPVEDLILAEDIAEARAAFDALSDEEWDELETEVDALSDEELSSLDAEARADLRRRAYESCRLNSSAVLERRVTARPRERRARRVVRSSSRDGPSSESDEPPPPRPRLDAAERGWLHEEVDRRTRARLQRERHLVLPSLPEEAKL